MMMRILEWARSTLRRPPTSAEVLTDLSRLVESDGSRPNIEQCLETVLKRSLIRPVVVIPRKALPKEGKEASLDSDAWNTDRRTISAWLESRQREPTGEAKLTTLFGSAREAPKRIAALVPVLSSTGSRLATVVIGKRRSLPLTDEEQSLIAAVVGMATLLLEQARLREMIGVAAEAETVKRLVEKHQRHVGRQYRANEGNLN